MDVLLEDSGLDILVGEDHEVVHEDLLAVGLLVVHTHSDRVLPCTTQILETPMSRIFSKRLDLVRIRPTEAFSIVCYDSTRSAHLETIYVHTDV